MATREIAVGKLEVLRRDGSIVPLAAMTPQEYRAFVDRCSKRLSETMSAYYSQHPDEFKRLGEPTKNKDSAPGGHPNAEQNNTTCRTGRNQYITPATVLQEGKRKEDTGEQSIP